MGRYKTGVTRNEYYVRSWRLDKKIRESKERGEPYSTREGLVKTNLYIKAKMKKMSELNDDIWKLESKIKEFIGVGVYKSAHLQDRLHKQARNIFLKYCLENGMKSRYLSDFVGAKNPELATTSRWRFNKSFKTSKENKELYHRWLEFLDRKNEG